MTILVIDDDRIVLESCVRILQAEGHRVRTTGSVQEALTLADAEHYDLLIVDMIMPEYDGISFLNEMERRGSSAPVLAMSGYPTPEKIADGLEAGAAGFIAKPFTPDELLDAVRKIREKSK